MNMYFKLGTLQLEKTSTYTTYLKLGNYMYIHIPLV